MAKNEVKIDFVNCNTADDPDQIQLLLNNWLLAFEPYNQNITEIIRDYLELGFNLNIDQSTNGFYQNPRLLSVFKVGLDFWRSVSFLDVNVNKNQQYNRNAIEIFAKAIAIISRVSCDLNMPLLKRLSDFSLIYLLHLATDNFQGSEKVNSCSYKVLAVIVSITKDQLFTNLLSTIITIEGKVVEQLNQLGLHLALDTKALLSKEQINNINLLQLFNKLTMQLHDANIIRELQLVPNQEINYQFNPYKANGQLEINFEVVGSVEKPQYSFSVDLKPKNIAVVGDIKYDSHFSNLAVQEEYVTWKSYGAQFELSLSGDLTLVKVDEAYHPKFNIEVAGRVVSLGGKEFEKLHIKSTKVTFKEDFSAADFDVTACILSNQKIFEVKQGKFTVPDITNSGNMYVLSDCQLNPKTMDNTNGQFHCGGVATLSTNTFNNRNGTFSGKGGTVIDIGKEFLTNVDSEVGFSSGAVGSKTTIDFKNQCIINQLGTIRGEQVEINNTPQVMEQGVISGIAEIVLKQEDCVYMPNVTMYTPLLRLQTKNFRLSDQHCGRTIIEQLSYLNKFLTFTHEYCTSGKFEIHEVGVTLDNVKEKMLHRFGDPKNYVLESLPHNQYLISFQATIKAYKGFEFLTPDAKIVANLIDFDKEADQKHRGLIALNGDFNAYTTECDLEKAGIAALNGFIWSPRGCHLGRLVEDPSRQAFATFYAHAHATHSCSLGRDIAQTKYTFLGQDMPVPVYDGRHLLTMPIATSNGSFINVHRFIKIIGQFNNQGTLNAKNLTVDSTSGTSIWEAGVACLQEDCNFTGNFTLRRTITDFSWQYYCNNQWGTPVWHPPGTSKFCNSDASELRVAGKLYGNCIITNEASILYTKQKSPEVQINSNDFHAERYQQFIGGTIEERKELSTAVDHSLHGRRGIHAVNGMVHNGCVPYAMGFLSKTNNFKDSQQFFPAITSSDSTVIMPARNTKLEGIWSASNMLIVTKGGQLALGSPNPYYIKPESPIRDLSNHKFNVHLTYINDQLKEEMEKSTKPKIHFLFRERFWFDEQASQDFYSDIIDHVVITVDGGKFKKLDPQTVFQLSPNYLLAVIIKECEDVLMRGYIYENRSIDLDLLKELHRNTTEFLEQNKLSNEEFQQALVLYGKNNSNFNAPEKPMIYYQALVNDQNLIEVLYPYLYIPVAMINKVRAQRGGLIETNILLIVSENLTPKQLIELTKNNPEQNNSLIKFFEQNPKASKYLEETALAAQSKALTVDPNIAGAVSVPVDSKIDKSHVEIGGTIRTKKIGIIVNGAVTVNGADLGSEDVLLASLFEDVTIKSIIGRVGGSENFDEVIMSQARVAAKNILQIYAGQNVVYQGAETESGIATQVQALANILDIPVSLVHQRVEHFLSKRESLTIKETRLEQHRSSHKSGGDISMESVTGTTVLVAPKVNCKKFQAVSQGETEILDTHEQRSIEVNRIEKTRDDFGATKTKSTHSVSSSQVSIGAELNVEELELVSGSGVKVCNIDSKARINRFTAPEGGVEIQAGRNSFGSLVTTSSSSMFWYSNGSCHKESKTYSESKFAGVIEIDAKAVTLEMVRNSTANFLQQMVLTKGNNVNCSILDPQYSIESDFNEGPGAALISLVAIATSIVTYGVCSGLSASLLSMSTTAGATVAPGIAMEHSALTAGFSTLCSQAAAAIVANNGDPLKAIKSLVTIEQAKSLAVTMATAGLLEGASGLLNLPAISQRDMLQHAQYNLARASVSATLNMSIQGKQAEQVLLDGLVDAAVGTALSKFTSKIDNWNELGEVGSVNHTVANAALGSVRSIAENVIKGRDVDLLDAALEGAIECGVSSTLHRLVDDKKVTAVEPDEMKIEMNPEMQDDAKDAEVALSVIREQGDKGKERVKSVFSEWERSGIFSDVLTFSTPKSQDSQIIDKYDLQQPHREYYEDYVYDDNQSFYKNLENSIKFGHGFLKGVVVNTGIGAACSLPVVGPSISAGLLFASAASAYAWASSKLSKFERDNFILSDDYENIMCNSLLISEQDKQRISRDAHARYEQVQQNRENASPFGVMDSVKEMWNNDPERLGSSVGLFFGFRKPIAGFSTINANPIKPGLPFKIHTVKSRIREAMLPQEGRIRFIPPSEYRPNVQLHKDSVINGFKDKFGNIWTKGPSRTLGEAFEWDVQLSELGKLQLGWLSRDGKHINVSLKGRITHR